MAGQEQVTPSAPASSSGGSPKRSRRVRRRWLTFSLRGLLLFVLACAVPLAIVSHVVRRARVQRAAVQALREAGAKVWYDYENDNNGWIESGELPGPGWLREWLGIDVVARVRGVHLFPPAHDKLDSPLFEQLRLLTDLEYLDLASNPVTNEQLQRLASLRRIKTLDLSLANIDDAGLEALAGMRELESLDWVGAPVGGAGLAVLRNCPSLQRLDLRDCLLSDTAFDNLATLVSLRELSLSSTPTTDRRLARLSALTGLRSLDLSGTKVTDAGLEALANMQSLESLSLGATAVNGSGLRALRGCKNLRELTLENAALDDDGLDAIAELSSLESLDLGNNAITVAGVARLARLPRLRRLDFSLPRASGQFAVQNDPQDQLRAFAAQDPELAGISAADLDNRLVLLAGRLQRAQLQDIETIRRIERIAAQVHEGPPDIALAVAQLLDKRAPSSWSFSERVRINGIYADAAARSDHPVDVFLVWHASHSIRAATEEQNQAFRAIMRESPHRELLEAIVAIEEPRFSCAAAALAADPCPVAWKALLDNYGLRGPLRARVVAAWRQADPKNAAAWLYGWDGEGPWAEVIRHRSLPLDHELLPLAPGTEGRDAGLELRLRPRRPALDDKLYAQAQQILSDAGFAVEPDIESPWPGARHRPRRPIEASDPWSWSPPTGSEWSTLVSRLNSVDGSSSKTNDDSLLPERLAAVQAIIRKFLVAPPRELGTVLVGCTMASNAQYSTKTELDEARGQARKAALDALARRIRKIVEDAARQKSLDEAQVAKWMNGLLDCNDETANAINRALDEWDQLDQRLSTATQHELAAPLAQSPPPEPIEN